MFDQNEHFERALGLAYQYLNRRDRTASEVRAHLEQRGVDEREREAVLALLLEQGYVDDARYARLFADDKRHLEQWGAERIRRGLVQRGIPPEVIDAVLTARGDEGDEDDEDDELGRAVDVLRRRFPDPPAERRERDRALGMLLRKGFDSEVAVDALAAYARSGGR